MNNKIFVVVLIVLAAVGFVVLKQRSPEPQPAQSSAPMISPPRPEQFVRPHSYQICEGAPRATLVQWFDPECEACRAIHPIFKKIVAEYKGRVCFVLRYMPYHGNSAYAAAALEEAREHGKFEQALDILFETQPEWGDHHAPKPELIAVHLAKLGIPKAKLERAYLLEKHGDKIKMDEEDGNAVGVRGTPSFFINTLYIPHLGEQPLRQAIEDQLKP